MKKISFVLSVSLVLITMGMACEKARTASNNCNFEPLKVSTVRLGVIQTPIKGNIVVESHYVTQQDQMNGYPKTSTQGIDKHLNLSCNELAYFFPQSQLGVACKNVYQQKWDKVWTPSENGNIGQGARDTLKPPLEHELWQANMFFRPSSFPKPGERWIVKNPSNGKAVVVAMGYELGPGGTQYVAGVSVESHFALDADNSTILEIGKAQDQTIKLGPINCN